MGHDDRLRVFAPTTSAAFGARVGECLGVPLADHEEREFEFGEHKSRPLVGVRGCDVYVINSLHGDATHSVNDKLCRLAFFAGALRDAGAERVTAVVPYLCYARKDRRTKPRDPVTTRYVAMMLESVGIDRVVTVDVHNPAAFDNAFRCRTEHLEARFALVDHILAHVGDRPVTVVSPDAGGVKRAERFREALALRSPAPVASAFVEKHRSAGVVRGGAVVGDLEDRVAVIVDDMIASGTTMLRAAEACRARGATGAYAVATHPVLTPQAAPVLADPALDAAIVTDTVPLDDVAPWRALQDQGRLQVVAMAGRVATAIDRLHHDGSIVDLVERDA